MKSLLSDAVLNLVSLHGAEISFGTDSLVVEGLRDEADEIWERLTERQKALLRSLSAALILEQKGRTPENPGSNLEEYLEHTSGEVHSLVWARKRIADSIYPDKTDIHSCQMCGATSLRPESGVEAEKCLPVAVQ